MVAIDGIGEEGPDLLRPGIEEKPLRQIGCDTQECSQLDCDFAGFGPGRAGVRLKKKAIPQMCTGEGEGSSPFSPRAGRTRFHDAVETQAGFPSDDMLPDTDGALEGEVRESTGSQ